MSEKKSVAKKVEKNEKTGVKPFDYKTWILVLLAVAALIVVIMAILNFTQNEKIDSSYFHDDDKKIVLTMDKEMSSLDDSPYESEIVHAVYYHDGTNITSMRVFYEYPDEEMAKIAMSKLNLGEFTENKAINGRFVIFQVKKSQYEDLTVEELRNDIELLNKIDALILDYNEETILRYPTSFPDEDELTED